MLARDRSGSPAGPFDVRIRYLGAPKDFPKDAKILGQKVAERKGRGPGVEGRWEVAELYPGRYWIAVSSPVFAPAAGSLELAPGEHGTFSLTLIPAGFLRGRIVSPDGEPVSGAHIGLDAAPGIRMDEDLWTPHTGSATSGPDGGFRTGPLHPGTYLFSVQTKGFPFFRSGRELEVEEGQETDLGEIRLPAGFTLKLRVTETDGTTPVADAGVEYAPRRDSPSVMSSWRKTRPPKTDAHGRVSISQINAGPWEIRVQSQGHARKELEVEVGPDLPEEKIVALDEELTIAGVVRDRNHGAPVERADVTAFPAGQDDMTRAFDSVNGNQRPLVVTAEDGTFRIGGLGPGRWVLRARHSAYAPLLSETVETALGKPEPRVTLLLSRGATLHVQLLDSDGAPLTGKIINLTRDGSFTTFGEDTDGAGQATFQNLAAGAYSLFVVLGEGATASGHVRLAEDEEAEVVLGGGRDLATVEGLVTRAGEPVAGLTLSLHGVDAAFPAGASTDERGFYRFEKDPAGFYDLDVRGDSGPLGGGDGLEVPRGGGEVRHDVRLSGNVLRVRVKEEGSGRALSAVPVLLRSTESGWVDWFDQTDSHGEARFQDLPPGRYLLTAGPAGVPSLAPSSRAASRVVGPIVFADDSPGTREIEVRLGSPARLRVKVLDASGRPVTGAGVFYLDPLGRPLSGYSMKTTDAHGVLEIDWLPPGPGSVLARREGAGQAEAPVRLEAGKIGEVSLALQPGTMVFVRVVRPRGGGLQGVSVFLFDSRRTPISHLFGVSESDRNNKALLAGREQVFGPLAPGRYTVVLSRPGEARRRLEREILPGDPEVHWMLEYR